MKPCLRRRTAIRAEPHPESGRARSQPLTAYCLPKRLTASSTTDDRTNWNSGDLLRVFRLEKSRRHDGVRGFRISHPETASPPLLAFGSLQTISGIRRGCDRNWLSANSRALGGEGQAPMPQVPCETGPHKKLVRRKLQTRCQVTIATPIAQGLPYEELCTAFQRNTHRVIHPSVFGACSHLLRIDRCSRDSDR